MSPHSSCFSLRAWSAWCLFLYWFFSRHRGDLYHPTLAYKFELEGDLVRRLGLGSRAILRDVVAALRARGLGEAEIEEARALLLELDHLRHRQDSAEAPPRGPPARFRAIVGAGERLRSRSGERA